MTYNAISVYMLAIATGVAISLQGYTQMKPTGTNAASEQDMDRFKLEIMQNPYIAAGDLVSKPLAGIETITDFTLQFNAPLPGGMGKAGVGSDGQYIYVTTWFGSTIDRYDSQGNFLDSFEVDGVGYLLGLAWDGTHFYGTDGTNTVYQMDFDLAQLTGILLAPVPVRGIAYDPDQDIFYGADLFNPIVAFAADGSLVAEFEPGTFGSFYGLAYDNTSEGGPFLWAFSQENNATLVQFSLPGGIETGVIKDVYADLQLSQGVAGGLATVQELIPGTVSLLGVVQSEALFAYELGLTQQFDKDMAVLSILAPQTGAGLSTDEVVTVEVRNNGTLSQQDVPLVLKLDGVELAAEILTGSIGPAETVEYTFSETLDLASPGQAFTVEVCTSLEGDQFPGNDCKIMLVTDLVPEYCIPTANCDLGDGINNFILGDIENLASGCSLNGYGDFTAFVTSLSGAEVHTVTFSSNYGNQQVSMWIDFDQDYTFEEEELLISDFDAFLGGELYSVDFEIPAEALSGETRLRIRANWVQSSADPCQNFTWGETEDYTVIIGNELLSANVGLASLEIPTVVEPGVLIPQATVKNYGSEAQSFPVNITIGDYSSTVNITNLASGQDTLVIFDEWNATIGYFSAQACTQLEGDEGPGNDCKTVEGTVISALAAYGYVNYDPSGQLEEGWAAFDVTDPGTLVQLNVSGLFQPLVGATWVDSLIYAVEYSGDLYTFDPATGEMNMLYNVSPLFGIAFDGTTFYGNSAAELFTLDITTGELTLVGAYNNPNLGGIVSIAADGYGELYGVDLGNDVLYFIDKETGAATTIGPMGTNFIIIQDIAFDKNTNILYFVGQTYLGETGLYVINTQTGEAVLTAPVQGNVHITALAIPSENTLFLPPVNLQAVADGGQVDLTWDPPFTGNYNGFNVYRDGELIAFSAASTFTDIPPGLGIYQYQVSTVFDEGESDLTLPVEVALGNPLVASDPGAIEEVLEVGESLVRELLIFNQGNIPLNFTAFTAYSSNANKSGSGDGGFFDAEAYALQAGIRFGSGWEDLAVEALSGSHAPEGMADYCIPYSNCNFGDGINSFELAEITNLNSGCSPSGYGDFTAMEATLTAGMTYDVSFSSSYSSNFVNLWIDLDQDEIFSEDERLIGDFELVTPGEMYSTAVSIPADAPNGTTRLRVMGSWLYSNQDPCQNTTFGETEDYTVVIGGGADWITLEPSAGSVAPGDTAVLLVTLDAAMLDIMNYNAVITINSNDTSAPAYDIPVGLTVLPQSLSNFEPVWESPFNPMSIFVVGALIDSMELVLGDEIGVFDIDPYTGQDICVGAGVVLGPVNGQNILEVVVSMDDGSNPAQATGFIPGNEIIYRLWNAQMGEVSDVTAEYPDPGFDEVFTPLGNAFVTLFGNALITQQMALQPGWNLVSSAAEPLNTNMMNLFMPLIESGTLEKVTDQAGGSIVYIPYPNPEGRWINSIGDMTMSEGYYVKVIEEVTVNIAGLPVSLPFEIPLEQGWNIMGYPSIASQDAMEVFEPLIGAGILYKVLDDAGGLIQYIPYPEPNGQWINTIGQLENGRGYYLKVEEGTSLILEDGQGKSGTQSIQSGMKTQYFNPAYQNNPYMPMHIILMTGGILSEGDEIGIFDGDVCVGAGVYDGSNPDMAITVTSMDDPDTEPLDGFMQGNEISIRIYHDGILYEQVETEFLSGSETFAALDSWVGSMLGLVTGIGENAAGPGSLKVAPNPMDDRTLVMVTFPGQGRVQLELLDLSGTLVREYPIAVGDGICRLPLDGADLEAGVYILRARITGNATVVLHEKLVVR